MKVVGEVYITGSVAREGDGSSLILTVLWIDPDPYDGFMTQAQTLTLNLVRIDGPEGGNATDGEDHESIPASLQFFVPACASATYQQFISQLLSSSRGWSFRSLPAMSLTKAMHGLGRTTRRFITDSRTITESGSVLLSIHLIGLGQTPSEPQQLIHQIYTGHLRRSWVRSSWLHPSS